MLGIPHSWFMEIILALTVSGLLLYLYRVTSMTPLWGAVRYGIGASLWTLAHGLGWWTLWAEQASPVLAWGWAIFLTLLLIGSAYNMVEGLSVLFEKPQTKVRKWGFIVSSGLVLSAWAWASSSWSVWWFGLDLYNALVMAVLGYGFFLVPKDPYKVPARLAMSVAWGLAGWYVLSVTWTWGRPLSSLQWAHDWHWVESGLWMMLHACVLVLGSFRAMRAFLRHSRLDPLTQTLNRAGFFNAHAHLLHDHRPDDPLAVLAIDLDHFKKINDEHMHSGGDEVLKVFASLLMSSARKTDIVARFGGEEFVVMLPGAAEAAAKRVAESIRQKTENCIIEHEGKTIRFTTSIGVVIGRMSDSPEVLLQQADECLYKAKEQGRNQTVVSKNRRLTSIVLDRVR